MREGQVPPARAGTRKEGQREKEAERERETEGPARAQRGASSGGGTRAGPTGRTPGVGDTNWTQLGWGEEGAERGGWVT